MSIHQTLQYVQLHTRYRNTKAYPKTHYTITICYTMRPCVYVSVRKKGNTKPYATCSTQTQRHTDTQIEVKRRANANATISCAGGFV